MNSKEASKRIQQIIVKKEYNTIEELFELIKSQYQQYQLTPTALGMIFELYAGVNYDENDPLSCYSREIPIGELVEIHPGFQSTNGSQWARSDNSYLGKKYKIKRPKKGGSVFAVQLDGPNNNSIKVNRGIRKDIVDTISKQRCVVLDISSSIEVDHKGGNYDALSLINKEDQKLSDFQPMSKAVNDAKRQHCKRCKESGKRYDARSLGYKVGFIAGDENTTVCAGCYWYDPKKFNEVISSKF